ncbi:MAG: hypothetical protein WED00_15360 [Aquisalimonadaceae bacterium]
MANWRKTLDEMFREVSKAEDQKDDDSRQRVRQYLQDVVRPAFEELKSALEGHGRSVDLQFGRNSSEIAVIYKDEEEFYFAIKIRAYRRMDSAFPIIPLEDEQGRVCRAEALVREGSRLHDVTSYDKDQLIDAFLYEYRRHVTWRR